MSIKARPTGDSARHGARAIPTVPVVDAAHGVSWIPESELRDYQRGQWIILIAALLLLTGVNWPSLIDRAFA